jgi:hypothetical protein
MLQAHEAGLVHRDIKPSNLMVSDQGQVKVLDLGLALLHAVSDEHGELTGSNQGMGTTDYMAPEQGASAHGVDIRADVYSLGCTLYKLLAGRAPFSGSEYSTPYKKMEAHAQAPVPPLRDRRPEVPEELAAVLERMLAKAPADRFATPGEAAAALQPFTPGCNLPRLVAGEAPAGEFPGAETGPFGQPTPSLRHGSPLPATVYRPPALRRHLGWAAAIVVGAGLAAAVLVWWPHSRPESTAPRSRDWTPGKWHEVLDRPPEPVFWPAQARLPQPNQEGDWLINCNGPGYIRLGTVPPGVRYRIQVGFKNLMWPRGARWRGSVGLFFGYHEEPEGAAFQQLLLTSPGSNKGRFSLQRSTGRMKTLPDGGKQPEEHGLAGQDVPPAGDREYILEIEVGKNGPLVSARWDGAELADLRRLQQDRGAPPLNYYHGDFGITASGCSAELTRARILIFDKD